MGIWFPDNENRGNRVEQLASDIEHFQEQVKQDVEDGKNHDERAIEYLNKLAKERGFKSLDDLIAEAESKLSQEDRDKYREMKNKVQELDDNVKLALTVGSGVMGIGAISGLSAEALGLLCNRQLVMVGFRMIAIGLLKLVAGETEVGLKLLSVAADAFSKILKGESLVGKAATAFKVLKVLGRVLAVLGVIIDVVTFVIDFVEESKQRDTLREATKELCVARVQVQMTKDYSRATLFFSADARATLDYADTLQGLVDDGTITQEKADEKLAEKIDEWIPKLKEAIEGVTEQSAYDSLKTFDDSRTSWTNEDPDYDYILEKIKNIQDESKKSHAISS
ncbi:hypothetical protein AMATHDRAFT_10195 [Amanita thiersii Skay4041]|uniref:Uncharacterized protein n=1 Tax=Amanita thiersii Skay4041 TaxID=703135 RepID=A0A2A9N6W6_9AGAR|nr:hypothetical protein AMATHDRAFT_10195 [Amanita thiersii Skay4041]